MYFSSKRDFWPWLIILLLHISIFITALFYSSWVLMVLTLLSGILLGWCWCNTGYLIVSNQLKIKCGPYRKTIPLKKIAKVRNIKFLLTNQPALAWFDTLEIIYNKHKRVCISPREREELKNVLKEKCKNADII